MNTAVSVLVVDDCVDLCNLMKLALTKYGYNVTIATSVKEAVNKLAHERTNVLISDYYLGDGFGTDILMESFQVPEVKILMTGFEITSSAFDYTFIKPINLLQFINQINHLINKINV